MTKGHDSWDAESSIANDMVRVVRFKFETNKGPGSVTVAIPVGVSIDAAKRELMDIVDGLYTSVEISNYEILKIITDDTIH